MFEYKTRTETAGGCLFYQQDILLFDYAYSGDFDLHCNLDYNTPGFGIVIAEYADDISQSENVYIVKLGARNEYSVIKTEYFNQKNIRDGFINPGKDINVPSKNLNLSFKFTEGYLLNVYAEDILILSYSLEHDIDKYKLGFYSSAGNVLKSCVIYSETPTNWTHNIWSGNGGRINWIDNGFEIEECEYPCEVESQNIFLKAGRYYLDYKTTNPAIEVYAFHTSKKVRLDYENYRGAMRYLGQNDPILVTTSHKDADGNEFLVSETKTFEEIYNPMYDDISENSWIEETRWLSDIDILQKDSEGHIFFELKEDSAINLRFRGKSGRVTEIAIKKNKDDTFVATGFDDVITKEASYLECDLSCLKKLEIEFIVKGISQSIEEESRHYIVKSGDLIYRFEDLALELDTPYNLIFDSESRVFEVNRYKSYTLDKVEDILTLLYNVDGFITKLIVTDKSGEETDILLQKTFKAFLPKEIQSPIICLSENNEPLDLSSSFREVCRKSVKVDIFNKYNEMKLRNNIVMGSEIRVSGIIGSEINTKAESLEEAAAAFYLLDDNSYTIDYINNVVKLPSVIKNKYDYLAVEYESCDTFRYEFTNYERQLVDLSDKNNIYLNHKLSDSINTMMIYGIPESSAFRADLLYRIADKAAINSIDYCASVYDELPGSCYKVLSNGRLILEPGIREKYKWLVLEYLKDDSYTVNERKESYEVDISMSEGSPRLVFDGDELNVTRAYSPINYLTDNAIEGNFIVLRKDRRQV